MRGVSAAASIHHPREHRVWIGTERGPGPFQARREPGLRHRVGADQPSLGAHFDGEIGQGETPIHEHGIDRRTRESPATTPGHAHSPGPIPLAPFPGDFPHERGLGVRRHIRAARENATQYASV